MVIALKQSRVKRSAQQPLDELDWKVVDMARVDGPRSLNPDGLYARLADLIGLPVPQSLANEKLEALRRFAVRAWYWDLIRIRDVSAILDTGYSKSNVFEILSHVGMARGFTPTVQDEAVSRPPRSRALQCRCG